MWITAFQLPLGSDDTLGIITTNIGTLYSFRVSQFLKLYEILLIFNTFSECLFFQLKILRIAKVFRLPKTTRERWFVQVGQGFAGLFKDLRLFKNSTTLKTLVYIVRGKWRRCESIMQDIGHSRLFPLLVQYLTYSAAV